MNLEDFTDENALHRWMTVPGPCQDKEPFELYVKIPGELELTQLFQSCKKKEVLEVPTSEETPKLAGHRQRRAARRPQFHVDDSDTDFVKLAGICADKYLEDWRGLYTKKDHKPIKFSLDAFKEKVMPYKGMWFVNELFALAQEFAEFQEEEQDLIKKT